MTSSFSSYCRRSFIKWRHEKRGREGIWKCDNGWQFPNAKRRYVSHAICNIKENTIELGTFLKVSRKIEKNLLFSVLILNIHLKCINNREAEKPSKSSYTFNWKYCKKSYIWRKWTVIWLPHGQLWAIIEGTASLSRC